MTWLGRLWSPGPRFLVLRDGRVAVGAYYHAKDARDDASELNEDAMMSGQPRRYEVIYARRVKNVR